jgi:hypothetical protein
MIEGHWRSTEGTDGTTQPEGFVAHNDGTQTPVTVAPVRALATLLAVVGAVTVDDAANAVGLTADDLVAEAQAWAMGQADPLQYNVI